MSGFAAASGDRPARRHPGGGGAAHPAAADAVGRGAAAHLAEHGIAVLADLPGVGANLHDHPMISPGLAHHQRHHTA